MGFIKQVLEIVSIWYFSLQLPRVSYRESVNTCWIKLNNLLSTGEEYFPQFGYLLLSFFVYFYTAFCLPSYLKLPHCCSSLPVSRSSLSTVTVCASAVLFPPPLPLASSLCLLLSELSLLCLFVISVDPSLSKRRFQRQEIVRSPEGVTQNPGVVGSNQHTACTTCPSPATPVIPPPQANCVHPQRPTHADHEL